MKVKHLLSALPLFLRSDSDYILTRLWLYPGHYVCIMFYVAMACIFLHYFLFVHSKKKVIKLCFQCSLTCSEVKRLPLILQNKHHLTFKMAPEHK